MESDIEALLAYGQMDLKAGYPDYARQYFQRVLALDASNQAAIEALERVDEALEHKMRETDLAEDEYWQSLPTELTELSQLQCKQLMAVLAELQKHRTILEKQMKDLGSIRSSASLVALIVVLAALLSIVSACWSFLLGPY